MSKKKIICPATPGSGTNTPFDQLTGRQKTSLNKGAQFTDDNFIFDGLPTEKDDRTFITDDFSKPFTLDDLDPDKVLQVQQLIEKTGRVTFRKDLSDGTILSLYGPLRERLRVGVENIIKNFPAAIVVSKDVSTNISGITATSISYNNVLDRTTLEIQQSSLKNDFDIEFTSRGNLTNPEDGYSELRNFTKTYSKYVLEVSGATYPVISFVAPQTATLSNLVYDNLVLTVEGQPFTGTTYNQNYLIRPSDETIESYFYNLDDTSKVLLNRQTNPKYTSTFRVPMEIEEGTIYVDEIVTWGIVDGFNLDIKTGLFVAYLNRLFEIADVIDNYKSNLITRFLITSSIAEFDTPDLKIDSVLKIYGHHFDTIKLFIDNIAYMRNVSYDKINNVPDLLLKNLAETLGLESVTHFTEKELNRSIYSKKDSVLYGEGRQLSIADADVEMYRRLLVNIGHLFKSKGTRKPIEFLMKFLGAPESLYEFNEHIYRVKNPLDAVYVNQRLDEILENGTYYKNTITYANNMYHVLQEEVAHSYTREDFPIDDDGYPTKANFTSDYYFQLGAGWFERTTEHKSEEVIDLSKSVLTGVTKTIKTRLKEFTYGQPYLDRFRKFPLLNFGFDLDKEVDNIKSVVSSEDDDERLKLNVKNIDLFISSAKGIAYDVWRQSNINNESFGVMPSATGMTFAEYSDEVIKNAIKNINRIKYIKKYVDLYAIYEAYIDYLEGEGKSAQIYSYKKLEDYIKGLSPYWIRLVEQFIPATTIWSGGNRLENSIFHRNKFTYKEPCKIQEFTDTLYPESFENVVLSEIELTIKQHPRGLCLLNSLSVQPIIDLTNTTKYGDFADLQVFSGYTKPDSCGFLGSYGTSLPLYCGYDAYLNFNENVVIDGWTDQIASLIDKINTEETIPACGYTGATYIEEVTFFQTVEWGVTGTTTTGTTMCLDPNSVINKKLLDYEFYTDGGVDKIRFKTYKHGYSDCTGSSVALGFVVDKDVTCYDCGVYAQLLSPSTGSTSVDCSIPQDLILKIYNGTPFESDPAYHVYVDCASVTLSSTGECDELLLENVSGDTSFEILIGDAANCQTRLKFLGFEDICIADGLHICSPIQEVLSTYELGFESNSYFIKILDSTLTGVTLNHGQIISLQEGVDYEYINPKDVVAGDLLLGGIADTSTAVDYCEGEATTTDWKYKIFTAKETSCIYSNKHIIINEDYTFLPNQDVYTVDGGNYKWIKAHNITENDILLDSSGNTVTVTGVTFDICTDRLYTNIQVQERVNKRVSLFNGEFTDSLVLAGNDITYPVYEPPQPSPSLTPSPTPTPTITPSITISSTPSPSSSALIPPFTPSPTPTISLSMSEGITLTPTPTQTVTPSPSPVWTTNLTIFKDDPNEQVTIMVDAVEYTFTEYDTVKSFEILTKNQSYDVSASVPDPKKVPMIITDGNNDIVISDPSTSLIEAFSVNAYENGITIFVGT